MVLALSVSMLMRIYSVGETDSVRVDCIALARDVTYDEVGLALKSFLPIKLQVLTGSMESSSKLLGVIAVMIF